MPTFVHKKATSRPRQQPINELKKCDLNISRGEPPTHWSKSECATTAPGLLPQFGDEKCWATFFALFNILVMICEDQLKNALIFEGVNGDLQ